MDELANPEATDHPAALIVDDDPVLRELFDAVLRAEGLTEVHHASDGNEAHAILAGRPEIEFIALDLNMPNCDGVGFMRHASRLGYRGRLVLVSSEPAPIRESASRLAELLGLNCIETLPKPADFTRIAALVSKTAAPRPGPPVVEVDLDAVRTNLEAGRLFACYQPRIDLQCGRLVAAEALARMADADGVILNTERVIDIAEDSGLIAELTWRMAEAVCADFPAMCRQIGRSFRLSFNLSHSVLDDPDFADRLVALVDSHGHQPTSFILEITESRLPSDRSAALEQLIRARMHGFGIAVDDFGTGHSNIENMREYPFTELKIDKSFLFNAPDDRFALAALEAGASLGRELGLLVVAEGVETVEAMRLVRDLGINEGQGYLFAQPLPLDEFLSCANTLMNDPALRNELAAGASAA